ncbi:MAG: BolA family transcriptional regulator [bacterium]|nr:BolA family transcriptional regulator [bacterium]
MSRSIRIQELITKQLSPTYLSVEDESSNHHVPLDAQSHFKLIVVSAQFHDLARIARHRLLNNLLQHEFTLGLHALSMHLYTEEEWAKQNVLKSPLCKDGFNK